MEGRRPEKVARCRSPVETPRPPHTDLQETSALVSTGTGGPEGQDVTPRLTAIRPPDPRGASRLRPGTPPAPARVTGRGVTVARLGGREDAGSPPARAQGASTPPTGVT